jgi:hypothetical protein
VSTIVIAVFTLGLRFWVGFVENPRSEKTKVRQVTLRHSLLFYRLNRRAAKVVRLIFYGWVAFLAWFATRAVIDVRDHPGELAADVALSIAFIGYAVGLRYWAASLGGDPQG